MLSEIQTSLCSSRRIFECTGHFLLFRLSKILFVISKCNNKILNVCSKEHVGVKILSQISEFCRKSAHGRNNVSSYKNLYASNIFKCYVHV